MLNTFQFNIVRLNGRVIHPYPLTRIISIQHCTIKRVGGINYEKGYISISIQHCTIKRAGATEDSSS